MTAEDRQARKEKSQQREKIVILSEKKSEIVEAESCFLCCVPAASTLTVGHCPGQSRQGPCISTGLQADFLWVNL